MTGGIELNGVPAITERPSTRFAIIPARRALIAALTAAGCGLATVAYLLHLWLAQGPIVDLRL